MAYTELRDRAQKLRRNGKSIRNITNILRANKSSVSHWCRDIKLSPPQRKKLFDAQRSAAIRSLLNASERRRRLRIKTTAAQMTLGAEDVGSIDKRDLFMIGLALYWGEGYKNGNEELGFTNSDPRVIRIFMKWMCDIYGTPPQDFILRVTINSLHRNRIEDIEARWSRITGIPKKQFTTPAFVIAKARKVYSNPEQYFGTLRVKVRRATSLRRRILGSIAAVSKRIR